jgi:glycosyltransferase involved in cell wall biosynthesis
MLALPVKHRLVIFSDDWGRHPSSCQHLAARLVKRYPIVWVNTIGMRAPSLNREDMGKAVRKLRSWMRPKPADNQDAAKQHQQVVVPPDMTVINPRMWPGFRTGWQKKLNARWVSQAVNAQLGPRQPDEQRIAITTLPITADLMGRLAVDRWVYYCVDDFSVWPGLDGGVMRDMEARQVTQADALVAVSQNLQQRLMELGGGDSMLLTHGIDVDHWSGQAGQDQADHSREAELRDRYFPDLKGPILLFWGLIDPRLDLSWLRALSQSGLGNIVLIGPQQSPDAALSSLPGVRMPGPAAYNDLPMLAQWADVLIMPYADLPVTRAMQPLKFKEYLATGKPVVARALPGIIDWHDASDLVNDSDAFVESVKHRLTYGVGHEQGIARQRLAMETWDHKASLFEEVICGPQA